MKYAFILGSSIYISNEHTLSYADAEAKVQFLKIVSYYDHHNNTEDSVLSIDADISSAENDKILIESNKLNTEINLKVVAESKRVQLYRSGHENPILDVMQLDRHEFHALSSHIFNEIEAQHLDIVFKIKGDFRVNAHHIVIDGETLHVNGDSFANGVVNAHQGVTLTADKF